ncbi:NUDIX domain-containing protein [Streptomyces shenzhenensis]
MDVVDVWNGQYACALQAALRLTNEAFADRLGIAPRTVATWHSNPEVVLRGETQQLLDELYETASQTVHKRFALLLAPDPAAAAGRGGDAAQPLRVAIAVVVREDQVLLVCRRDDGASGITWQFPAGVIKPGVHADTAAVRETFKETGVRCAALRDLGTRLHPVTAVQCEYFLCEYLAGEATNSDIDENVDVMWVPKASVTRFIPVSNIFPPILVALEEPRDAEDQR